MRSSRSGRLAASALTQRRGSKTWPDKGQTLHATRASSVVPHPVEKKPRKYGASYLGTSNFRSYASKVVRVFPYSTKSFTNEARFDAASAFDFRYC